MVADAIGTPLKLLFSHRKWAGPLPQLPPEACPGGAFPFHTRPGESTKPLTHNSTHCEQQPVVLLYSIPFASPCLLLPALPSHPHLSSSSAADLSAVDNRENKDKPLIIKSLGLPLSQPASDSILPLFLNIPDRQSKPPHILFLKPGGLLHLTRTTFEINIDQLGGFGARMSLMQRQGTGTSCPFIPP